MVNTIVIMYNVFIKFLREGVTVLFNKKIEPSCSYCIHGSQLDDREVICVKKGIVSSAGKCRKFEYDPLSRRPPAPVVLDTSSFSEDDFTL